MGIFTGQTYPTKRVGIRRLISALLITLAPQWLDFDLARIWLDPNLTWPKAFRVVSSRFGLCRVRAIFVFVLFEVDLFGFEYKT